MRLILTQHTDISRYKDWDDIDCTDMKEEFPNSNNTHTNSSW